MNNSAVFLVGCHRSGTTLLRFILDAHPRLACPPESKFISGVDAFLTYPQVRTGLQSMGVSRKDILHALRRMTESFFSSYARAQGKPRWVDKTPNYYRHLRLIDEMFDGEARYIFLVRQPCDCIASLETSPYFAGPQIEDPDVGRAIAQHGRGRTGWARYWLEVNDRLRDFAVSHPERTMIVRYEDLVRRSEHQARRILDFIGEDFPAGLLASTFSVEHSRGYEDLKVRETSRIHRESVGRSDAWPRRDVECVWKIVGPTAEFFGYCLEERGVVARPRRTRATRRSARRSASGSRG